MEILTGECSHYAAGIRVQSALNHGAQLSPADNDQQSPQRHKRFYPNLSWDYCLRSANFPAPAFDMLTPESQVFCFSYVY